MVRLFAGQLDGIPKKGVRLYGISPGSKTKKKWKKFKKVAQALFFAKGRTFLMQSGTNEPQKLASGFGISEFAGKGRGSGNAVLFLYAAHHHTHVLGLDDDGNAQRLQGFLNYIPDFDGEALLYLQSTRKNVDYTWYFT